MWQSHVMCVKSNFSRSSFFQIMRLPQRKKLNINLNFIQAPANDVYEVRHCESPLLILLFCKNVFGDEAVSRCVHEVKFQQKLLLPNNEIATAQETQYKFKFYSSACNDGKERAIT